MVQTYPLRARYRARPLEVGARLSNISQQAKHNHGGRMRRAPTVNK